MTMSVKNSEPAPSSVWIVEDNAMFRENLLKLVSNIPWVVDCKAFQTGEQVLAASGTEIPPDLLLIDLGLPGIDGIGVLQRMKRISPATRMLILTIQDDDEHVFRAISGGADGYLLKASTPEAIMQSIRDVVNGGSPINAFIASKILSTFKTIAAPANDYGLTEREKEILEHLVHGLPRKKIAETLFLSYHTIDFHIRNIYSKLQVNSQTDAVAKSIREKLI